MRPKFKLLASFHDMPHCDHAIGQQERSSCTGVGANAGLRKRINLPCVSTFHVSPTPGTTETRCKRKKPYACREPIFRK